MYLIHSPHCSHTRFWTVFEWWWHSRRKICTHMQQIFFFPPPWENVVRRSFAFEFFFTPTPLCKHPCVQTPKHRWRCLALLHFAHFPLLFQFAQAPKGCFRGYRLQKRCLCNEWGVSWILALFMGNGKYKIRSEKKMIKYAIPENSDTFTDFSFLTRADMNFIKPQIMHRLNARIFRSRSVNLSFNRIWRFFCCPECFGFVDSILNSIKLYDLSVLYLLDLWGHMGKKANLPVCINDTIYIYFIRYICILINDTMRGETDENYFTSSVEKRWICEDGARPLPTIFLKEGMEAPPGLYGINLTSVGVLAINPIHLQKNTHSKKFQKNFQSQPWQQYEGAAQGILVIMYHHRPNHFKFYQS